MSVRWQGKQERQEKKQEQEQERRKIVNLAYLAEHQISIFLSTELDS